MMAGNMFIGRMLGDTTRTSRVIHCPGLPVMEGFPRVQDSQCSNKKSSRQMATQLSTLQNKKKKCLHMSVKKNTFEGERIIRKKFKLPFPFPSYIIRDLFEYTK